MHYTHPDKKHAHVVLLYRDFKDYGDYGDYGDHGDYHGKCHRGLGINALMTAKVLRKAGIHTDLCAVSDVQSVKEALSKHSPTHAIIQALWISSEDQAALCMEFPDTHFIVRCHSQIGFLQVEPKAIKILRDLMFLQEGMLNLSVSANTHRLHEFLHHTYKSRVVYLPNLYDLDRVQRKRDESHGHRTLRIGSFGAHRLLKNHTTAAAAALMMAERRGSDLEFYVNSGRKENEGKDAVLQSLKHMFAHLRWAKLVEVPWEEWSQFRQTVAHMDLTMQVSFTETCNIVTCDSIAEGVPAVVSDAIEWVPERWKAHADDAHDIARVGSGLLWDTHAAEEGLEHLKKYQTHSICEWLTYLSTNPTG